MSEIVVTTRNHLASIQLQHKANIKTIHLFRASRDVSRARIIHLSDWSISVQTLSILVQSFVLKKSEVRMSSPRDCLIGKGALSDRNFTALEIPREYKTYRKHLDEKHLLLFPYIRERKRCNLEILSIQTIWRPITANSPCLVAMRAKFGCVYNKIRITM